jgi:Inorganic pyrophosphatase
MMQEPVVPMCFMRVRPIGVMHMIDGGEQDDKIIAVHLDDPEYKHLTDICQVPKHRLAEIRYALALLIARRCATFRCNLGSGVLLEVRVPMLCLAVHMCCTENGCCTSRFLETGRRPQGSLSRCLLPHNKDTRPSSRMSVQALLRRLQEEREQRSAS